MQIAALLFHSVLLSHVGYIQTNLIIRQRISKKKKKKKWHIASIPIADILQKDEHHVGVLKGHQIQCFDCTLPVHVQI